jgi:hypothetical protein
MELTLENTMTPPCEREWTPDEQEAFYKTVRIDRIPVECSQIASIGYNADAKKLHIEFKSWKPGAPPSVYEYDVPADVHAALMAAESHGSHFGKHIKGARGEKLPYAYRKLPNVAAEKVGN